MSFDDELRARMKAAADAAGRGADPAAAAAHLAATTGRGAGGAGPALKLVSGLGAVGLVGGAVLGATVLRPSSSDAAEAAPAIDVSSGAIWDCPDGSIVGELRVGDRVFVIGRDEGADWSAIRDPRALGDTVWVPRAALDADADTPSDVPVLACDGPTGVIGDPAATTTTSTTTTTTTVAPTTTLESTTTTTIPVSTTTVAQPPPPPTQPATTTTAPPPPTTTTTPPPPGDTQAPTIQQASANPTTIYACGQGPGSQLTVVASDNVGVVSVTGSYQSGLPGSPLAFALSGGTWRATFGPFTTQLTQPVVVPITIVARDAAGNQAQATVSVTVDCVV